MNKFNKFSIVAGCLAWFSLIASMNLACAQQTNPNHELLPDPLSLPPSVAQPEAAELVQPLHAPDAAPSFDVRIKDISRVAGFRKNKLTGMGLVTGLNGTGSKNPVTRQFALNMLERFGLRGDPEQREQIRTQALDKTDNLSVVTVTAEVDVMHHKNGNAIDVTVSTFDDASSLQGGVLMWTPLYGVDGEVYAVASGPLSIGGFSFSGDAATVQKNHPTTGRISGGAIVEKELCLPDFQNTSEFRLNLNEPDLETASRMAHSINQFWPGHARLVDAGVVEILIAPPYRNNPNQFIAMIQSIRVVPDTRARVVINERTGTVVVGDHVRLSRVAITHANLSVITGETPSVSQPAPFSRGQTTVVPRTNINVLEESGSVNVIDRSVTVGELARALNALGVTPRDLSSIFQQLKAAGALHGELEFQ